MAHFPIRKRTGLFLLSCLFSVYLFLNFNILSNGALQSNTTMGTRSKIEKDCTPTSNDNCFYGKLPPWLPQCEKIFLDLGSNIGVTVRKMFEPQNYPGSTILPYLKRSLGYEWYHSGMNYFPKKFCALGFEPNPKHKDRLNKLQEFYTQMGWNVHFLPLAATDKDGYMTFYTTDNSKVWEVSIALDI